MRIQLLFLLVLPLALNAQDGFLSLTQASLISPQMSSSSWDLSAPTFSPRMIMIDPQITNRQTITLCGLNQVPNHQNICLKPVYIQGCQLYETSKRCYTCATGYRLDANKMCDYNPLITADKITHIKGCLKQNLLGACETCAEGFYKVQDKCVVGVQNCLTHNLDRSCLQCKPDYSLILSKCRHNNLLGCRAQTVSHTCSQCYAPFQLQNSFCKISNCRILNDYGCVACECGFYLNQQRTCSEISPGCLRYQKGVCKDCLPHYKLKGGVCEIQGCLQYKGNYCKVCSDRYELLDGECKFKNCYDWLNDQCVACEKGFVLKAGLCQKAIAVECN